MIEAAERADFAEPRRGAAGVRAPEGGHELRPFGRAAVRHRRWLAAALLASTVACAAQPRPAAHDAIAPAPLAAEATTHDAAAAAGLRQLDAAIRAEPPLTFHALSPYVASDAFPLVEPAVVALRQRLRIVERTAQGRGLPVRHTFQALYGSGFLRDNPVGNDLDYEYAVHLGPVRLPHGAPEAAAEELLARMESYLQVLEATFLQQEDAALAVLNFRLLRDGAFKRRDELARRLATSLRDVAAERPHVVLVDSLYGVRVPTVLPPDESYVYETTRIELVSDRVRTVDWMFPGIRGFQVMFHFYCDLEVEDREGGVRVVRDLPLHPTFVPAGKVLTIAENVLGTIPVDDRSAAFFTAAALDAPEEMVDGRLAMAQALLAEVDRNLAAGDSLKALKRLYQAGDALAPGLPPAEAEALRRLAGAAMAEEDLLLCGEIAELADMAAKVFRIPALLGLYRDAYTLQRTLIQLNGDLRRLGYRHAVEWPAARTARYAEGLRKLGDVVAEGFPSSEERTAAEAFLGELEDLGGECESAFLPPRPAVERLAGVLRQRLRDAGLAVLPVYGLADGSLGALAADLARLEASGWAGSGASPSPEALTEALVAAGAPPFPYRPLAEADVPVDRRGERLPPVELWLRADRTAAAEASWAGLRAALHEDHARFGRLPAWAPEQLREGAAQRVAGRFGEAGERAWASSRTAGDGLLALLGEPDEDAARELLAAHLALLARVPAAARFLPPAADGDIGLQRALERALATTAERILEGVAVGRTSAGRRGLSAAEARRAQGLLGNLLDALEAIGGGTARVAAVAAQDEALATARYSLVDPGGRPLSLLVRPRRSQHAQSRLGVDPPPDEHGDALQLRFDASATTGAAFDLQVTSPRLDWGIHGPLPTNPEVSDHHFWDGLPPTLLRPKGPRERTELAAAFAAYLEDVFVPQVIGRLPAVPTR